MRQKRLNEVNADKGEGTQRQREGRKGTISKLMVEGEVNLSGCHMRCGSVLISIFEF